MQNMLEHVGVSTRRNGIEEISRDELTACLDVFVAKQVYRVLHHERVI